MSKQNEILATIEDISQRSQGARFSSIFGIRFTQGFTGGLC